MPYSSVILDLDGTLVDTNAAHVDAYLRVFPAFGYDVDRGAIEKQVGKGGDKLVPALIGEEAERRHGDAIRDQAKALFVEDIAPAADFQLFPSVMEFLEELFRSGLRTAIATSSADEQLDAIFSSAGIDLREHVDVTTTKSDVDESKPDADVFETVLDKLGVSPEEAVVIGDTIYDVEAARRAGVSAIGVTTWVWDAEALRDAGAVAVFEDVDGVLRSIRNEGIVRWTGRRAEPADRD